VDRHVIVRRSSEVIEMADSRPAVAEPLTERGQAFLRLADEHLDSAYRLARAILHDATDAQDATHEPSNYGTYSWAPAVD
jgi:hypothetical protein